MRLHHPLLIEFAEYRDTIQRLKDQNSEFRQLAEEYHEIDRRVCLIERQLEPASDAEMEALKMRRVWLKDTLYREIRKAAAQAA